jgi:hypothetical protein
VLVSVLGIKWTSIAYALFLAEGNTSDKLEGTSKQCPDIWKFSCKDLQMRNIIEAPK